MNDLLSQLFNVSTLPGWLAYATIQLHIAYLGRKAGKAQSGVRQLKAAHAGRQEHDAFLTINQVSRGVAGGEGR